MDRLAISGWTDQAARLLAALQDIASVSVAAIGDRDPAALVRARAATGSPCYQHSLEMLRSARYDTALIALDLGAAQAAETAASAGAAVLLSGACADGTTLVEAAEATMRAHVPLAVLRPRLQEAGIAFLLDLAAGDAGWRPRYIEIGLAGPTGAPELARDAVAIAGRMLHATPESAVGFVAGDEELDYTVLTADLRYADGSLASLRARTAGIDQTTIFAECALGDLDLRSEDGTAMLTITARDGRRETSRMTDGDTFALEARRALRALAGEGSDALLAPRDGSVLCALEQSIETGQVVAVEERSSRANLVLVEGRGVVTSTPSGRLHLVGV